jgi:nucleotide-binding universal stress UspA family protein
MSRDLARILVPTDFSPASNGAVAFAKTLALRFGASLHLVHVLEDWPMREIAAAHTLLDAQLSANERTRLRATTIVLRGSAAETIVDYAGAHAVDLIVMGTKGQGGPGALGRIVERVVRLGRWPVLTVKEESAASTFV